ncbi:MAG: aldo/keto reductase [bacterium]
MEYRKLGSSDLNVSTIALGTWATGSDFYGKVDDTKSIDAIRAGIENGINLIDTAPAYGSGHAEKVVGEAIKGYRDKAIIATKCGVYKEDGNFIKDLTPETIRNQLETSLKSLGVEVIDLYQIHWPDPNTPLEDTVNELNKLKKEGKFRYLGVSNFDQELMGKIQEMTEIVSIQPQYSILHRDFEKDLSYVRKNNIGVLAYGPLGGGILTGKYTDEPPKLKKDDQRNNFYPYFQEPQWSRVKKLVNLLEEIAEGHNKPVPHVALNWVRQQEGVSTVLVGTKNAEQAIENANAADWKLSSEELKIIDEAYSNLSS